jgi:hypothetical protein
LSRRAADTASHSLAATTPRKSLTARRARPDRTDRRLVDGDKLRSNRRRPDDAAVQHAVDLEIVDEHVAAVDLARNVGPRER